VRLRASHHPGEESESIGSAAAVAAGEVRKLQGYTAAMLVHDSRILQVTLFGMLQRNLSALDLRLLLPDVLTTADEVDSQLTPAMARLHERRGDGSGCIVERAQVAQVRYPRYRCRIYDQQTATHNLEATETQPSD
jgi:hypothetical protein